MSLIENSTPLSLPENSKVTAINIATPDDTNYPSCQLAVIVDALPSSGTVLLPDGVTPVTVNQNLTVAQLTGLQFKPAANSSGENSTFAFDVSDPDGNTVSAAATIAIVGSNTNSDAGSSFNSSLGVALNISVPSEAASLVAIEVTELPTNGTVVLSDGTSVGVGQNLTSAQLSGLRFKSNPAAPAQSGQFSWDEATTDGAIIPMTIGVPVDPEAPGETPAVAPAPTDPTAVTPTPTPSDPLAATNPVASATTLVSSATSEPGSTQAQSFMTSVGANTAADPSGGPLSATAMPVNAPSSPPLVPNPVANGDPPGSYSAVFGMPLDINVPSEAPSPASFQITALPTNAAVVLADGTTPVSVGQSLTPAQAAALRIKPNGVAQNSHFDFDEVIPGMPPVPRSINFPFDSNTNSITLPTTSHIAPDTTALATLTPATAGSAAAAPIAGSAATAAVSNPNPVVLENQKAGTPQSVWEIGPGDDSTQIQGFTTSISTPLGGTVQFKIDNETGNGNYQIQIYRLGYYGGDGATLVTTLNHSGSPVVQPNPLTNAATGEVDAGNWSVTDSWAVPSTATSGVYVANVIDGSQIFQIPFVVTNPSSTSDIVFQTSDETWQAYNGWGGANLYGGNGPANPPPTSFGQGAAFAVSYNRPIVTRDSVGTFAGPQDSLFGAEYAAIYWLEENGYNVSYISGIDTATNGSLLLNHKVFMDAGHDEYWTDSQVANVEAAAAAGVNLAFLSGNELFWQTRLSPSLDSSATANRTLVSYKDTHFNQEIDPTGHDTGTFEDPRLGRPAMPGNEVDGELFQVDGNSGTQAITIPFGETQLRVWRNTSVATTTSGHTASLEPDLLGYEWDSAPDNPFTPAGLVDLSTTTLQEPTAFNTDFGNVDTSGTATNSLVEYRDPTSGALVFGTGTVFWSWGLSNQHDNSPSPFSSSTADPNVQQATVNMLADMGVQPQTLQASLVLATQSTDHTAPTSTISNVSSTNVVEGQTVTVSGTATDAGGGVVGGVEVSTDGGQTWNQANSPVGSVSVNWTYSFSAPPPGTYKIESRAVDDSANLGTPSSAVSYTVTPSSNLSLFSASTTPPTANDPNAIELGVKFTSATSGLITGIRFYKGSANTGTHVGNLWTASGTLLRTATFTNETASGWQQVNFSSPVSITAGTTYIASYHTNTGDYADTPYFFTTYTGQTDGSLNAAGDGINGLFAYSSSSAFPNTTSVTGDNYWVDVVFNDTSTAQTPPVLSNFTASSSYTAGGAATTLSSGTTVSDPESANLVSGTVSISSGFLNGDTLAAATTGTSISQSYNTATGVLSLSGSDTLAHYQQVLDSVKYSSTNQNPTNFGADASRTVSFVVSDGTLSSATKTTTVNISGGPTADTLFSPSAIPTNVTENDPNAVDLGVKFQASSNGTITGIRFYKGPQNTGTHLGDLWNTSGTLLASATFTNETASGWQQVNFSSPVSITAGTTYIGSYEAPVGEYSADLNYFANSLTNGPLTAPSSSSSGGNGVFAYGSANPFPNGTFSASNYWVDVVFSPGTTPTPPVLNNVAASASYIVGGAATTLSSGTTVSDAESTNLVSGTVSISSGFLTGDTLAATTTNTSISASYNTATGVLSLTGSDTLAHYQSVLDSVKYSSSNPNPTNSGADASRTVSFVVSDGTLSSTTQNTTVNITGTQPVLSNVAASASYTVGGAATTLSSGTTVSDAESTNLVSGSVSISSGFLTGDTLAATTTGTSVSASYNTATGVLSLTGSDTLAHYQSVLDSVKYSSSNPNPTNSGADASRSVSLAVSDGTLSSATQTTTVNITGSQAPVLSNVAASASYTVGGAATTLSSGTTVSDAESTNLVSGTVSISSGFLTGDTLAATTTGTSISASYNTATGVLSLTGSDTLAHYQSVLDSVKYSSSNPNPTNSGADASRSVSLAVSDGTLSSATQTTTVNISGGSTTASLFGPSATPANVTENDPNAVDLGVKFQASSNGTITGIRFYKGPQNTGTHLGDLWNTSGTLLASATFTNETASGWQQVNFSSPVSITAGTTYIASYHTNAGEYSANENFFTNSLTNGPLTAPSSSSSGGNGVYAYGSANLFPNSTFSASNYWVDVVFSPGTTQTPPVLSSVAASASYTVGGAATTLSSGTTVSDAESTNLVSGTVSISSGFLTGDTLAATTTNTSISASYNTATGVLSLTGSDTLAHYQSVLDSVKYSSSNPNPTNSGADASRSVSLVVNDGTLSSATKTTTVNITGSQAPVLSSVAASASYTVGGAATTLSSGTTVSDAESTNLVSGTVSISSGFLTGDTLAATTTGTSISASYNTATGVLSLTGSDTLAHYQSVLDSVKYSSSNPNPTNSGADASRSVSLAVSDGTLSSATQTTTVNITGSQAPVLSSVAASASYTVGGAATTLSSGTTVSDAESTNLVSGSVSISSGFLTGDTLAATTTGTSVSASYNTATGVLSLTGSDTLAHYQSVLDSVKYSSSNPNPTNSGADASRSVSLVVNDGTLSSATKTTTVNITGSQAPVLSNVAASASYTVGGAATTLSSGTTVSDAESTNLVSGTVSISSGFLTGDTLAATTTGTSISASYNTATGVLSLTGSDTLAHYQSVLDNVKYSSSNPNPTNSGADASRSVSLVVNDGTLSSATKTTTVNITGSQAPVLSNVAASASYTVGGAATTLSSGTTVSDAESTNLVSGTVSISSGFLTGDTLAATTTGTSISASYNTATGVLSLTGSDTLAHYQSVLDSVKYSSSNPNPTNSGADASRSVSLAVSDGTLSSATQTTTVNISGGSTTASLFGPSATPANVTENDPNAVDLGVKFQASSNGTITGIRFYKGPQNTGTHLGDLWNTSGTLLASATFTNETASGWQQVNFSSPVSITAGTTYIASYHTNAGEYSANENFFTNSLTNGPLTAPSSSSSGGNGVYAYGSANLFPNSTFSASNYWVDVVFNPQLSG